MDIALDGHEAVEKWKACETYDLILMDVQMPGISGIEATTKIRSMELSGRRPAIPIIALTAYSEGEEKEEMLSAGVTDYISKPVHINSLLEILQREKTETIKTPASENDTAYKKVLLDEFYDAEETLAEMLEMSLEEFPRRLESIRQTVTSRRISAAEHCHSLANVAGILQANILRDEAIDMENVVKKGKWNDADAMFSLLDKHTRRLMQIFRKLLENDLA